MSQIEPNQSRQPIISNTQVALIIYILYFAAYVVGITAVIGVVMAHVQYRTGDPMLDSHYQFQIRTFWISVLYGVLGFVLMFVVIGFAVWAWWFIWSLIRNIKGVMALNEHRPIANPTSWLFG